MKAGVRRTFSALSEAAGGVALQHVNDESDVQGGHHEVHPDGDSNDRTDGKSALPSFDEVLGCRREHRPRYQPHGQRDDVKPSNTRRSLPHGPTRRQPSQRTNAGKYTSRHRTEADGGRGRRPARTRRMAAQRRMRRRRGRTPHPRTRHDDTKGRLATARLLLSNAHPDTPRVGPYIIPDPPPGCNRIDPPSLIGRGCWGCRLYRAAPGSAPFRPLRKLVVLRT